MAPECLAPFLILRAECKHPTQANPRDKWAGRDADVPRSTTDDRQLSSALGCPRTISLS